MCLSVYLQVAAEHCIQIDFVAIADGGEGSMSELDLANFATGLADHENASASYCPCGEYKGILLASELQ